MVGHIKLDRKILEWEWYFDLNVSRLFIHLLLIANHKDGRWQGNEIKRGQVITGLSKLSAATGLSVMQIRTCFDKLKSTNELTIKVTNRFRVITICKYDVYQSFKNEYNNQNECIITREQQTSNKQVTANNNVNNDNNERVNGKIHPVIDISKSNLFRQPTIPTKIEVWECFSMQNGTKEMAKTFYDNNEGTGWYLKGSPITNFKNLVPKFIANWKKFENKNTPIDSTNVKIILK